MRRVPNAVKIVWWNMASRFVRLSLAGPSTSETPAGPMSNSKFPPVWKKVKPFVFGGEESLHPLADLQATSK